MIRPVDVRPLADFRIWLRYQDGTEGEVDLSRLAGRGVFYLTLTARSPGTGA